MITNWKEVEIPCGQCLECRLARTRDWSQRLMNELPKHNYSYFLTITYNNENLPFNPKTGYSTLRKEDMQKFFKRWRKGQQGYKAEGLTYYYCGEYGSMTERRHYHRIVFTDNPIPDLKYHGTSEGMPIWVSEKMDKIWGKGYIIIGNVTTESTTYVAGYITKKKLGKESAIYDERGIVPPYTNNSQGIGKLEQAQILKMYEFDKVYMPKKEGVRLRKPAKIYDQFLRDYDEKLYDFIKEKRRENRIRERENELSRTTLTRSEYRETKAKNFDSKFKSARSKI